MPLVLIGDSIEGQVLEALKLGDHEKVDAILSEPKSHLLNLSAVVDSDGKTMLHLACQKAWVDWSGIIYKLVKDYQCNASAVDEDGNTPLHDAYHCGNPSSFAYLLSLPAVNPDAVNKQDYTVLRMALEKNDKIAVRNLLATGRVDPRRGTSRGHTYRELLEMNSLQPTDQEYDGSALQMAEQFADCIQFYSLSHPHLPSYQHCCLLRILHKLFKNRQQILISGLLETIKRNMLPLPENPTELNNLLKETRSITNSFTLSDHPSGIMIETMEEGIYDKINAYYVI